MMPDNLDLFNAHEDKQERWLKKRPKCDECKEHIQEEHCYLINGGLVCEECLGEIYRVDTDNFEYD